MLFHSVIIYAGSSCGLVTQTTVLFSNRFLESLTTGLCLSVDQSDNARRLISHKDTEQRVRGLRTQRNNKEGRYFNIVTAFDTPFVVE